MIGVFDYRLGNHLLFGLDVRESEAAGGNRTQINCKTNNDILHAIAATSEISDYLKQFCWWYVTLIRARTLESAVTLTRNSALKSNFLRKPDVRNVHSMPFNDENTSHHTN